ncbi:hypothetical protein PR001_g9742 [Phytophthora rubi]|uniref:Uncharacterized protein n=1 Tax=Phytophthora rubi TaxID=129364 RepID=A0A6A3N067_9STRA|nr:hypothetical protein PR001_g9742 [Phytophthora rubi]
MRQQQLQSRRRRQQDLPLMPLKDPCNPQP